MNIPFLPIWNLMPTLPAFYDTESVTMLELASKLSASFNNMVGSYNEFAENVNTTMQEFITETTESQETFEVAIRQEFQDFIDVVNLSITTMQNQLNEMENNMEQMVNDEVNAAINSGRITITERYDPETESLYLVMGGE